MKLITLDTKLLDRVCRSWSAKPMSVWPKTRKHFHKIKGWIPPKHGKLTSLAAVTALGQIEPWQNRNTRQSVGGPRPRVASPCPPMVLSVYINESSDKVDCYRAFAMSSKFNHLIGSLQVSAARNLSMHLVHCWLSMICARRPQLRSSQSLVFACFCYPALICFDIQKEPAFWCGNDSQRSPRRHCAGSTPRSPRSRRLLALGRAHNVRPSVRETECNNSLIICKVAGHQMWGGAAFE